MTDDISKLKKQRNIDPDDHSYDDILKNYLNDDGSIKPGTIYMASEPEFVGAMPIRSEIEILPADECKTFKLGWTCNMYSGSEVFKFCVNGNVIDVPLTKHSDLKPGTLIYAPTLVGSVKAVVERDKDGKLIAVSESGKTLILLTFNGDDRHCWTTDCAINVACLTKTEKKKK